MKPPNPTVCLAAVIVAAALPAFAQHGAKSPDLSLRLELSARSVVLGEPVFATTHLLNGSKREVSDLSDLDPSGGDLSIRITRPDGVRTTFRPLSVADREQTPVRLEAGQERTAVFPIYFGGRGWTFPVAGSYRLAAVLRRPGVEGELRSEPVSLDVREGKGAGRFLFDASEDAQLQAGKFLVWRQGDHLRKGLALVEEAIARYPGSPLAVHGELALGLNLSRPFSDYSVGRTRPAKPAEALERLEAIDSQQLPAPLEVERQLGIARALAGLERRPDAARALGAARARAGGLESLRRRIDDEIAVDPMLRGL